MLHSFFERRIFPLTWTFFLHLALLFPDRNSNERKLILIPHFDKLVHFGLYFVLVAGWVVFFNLKTDLTTHQKRNWNYILILVAIAHGIIIEFLQGSEFISRDFDWYDALADGFGAIAGMVAGQIFTKKILRQSSTH